jgi:diguanylate cyclase (GGDEF)-like protein/PAS domain S-box-containing protein
MIADPMDAGRNPTGSEALHQFPLIDTEGGLDRLSRLALRLVDAPVALITLVDEQRQFLKARTGSVPRPSEHETVLLHSFCRQVIAANVPLVITDVREHSVARDNLATREMKVVAYLGIPITTSGGVTLGSFSVIDHEPRTWSETEIGIMHDLIVSVASEIELRREVMERRKAEEALQRHGAYFRALIEHTFDIVLVLNSDATIRYCSSSSTQVLGHASDEFFGMSAFDLLHPDDLAGLHTKLGLLLNAPGQIVGLELRARHADGTWRTLDTRIRNVLDDEAIGGIIVNGRDITDRKQVEARLTHDPLYDSLTGLANRTLFFDRLTHSITQLKRYVEHTFAIFYLDLHSFAAVNERLGRAGGDAVLLETARRLRTCVRPSDTVARLGGDEFAVIIDHLDDDEDVEVVSGIADRIQRAIRIAYQIEGEEIDLSATIGIAFGSPRHAHPDDVLREADSAMHQARQHGQPYQAFISQVADS